MKKKQFILIAAASSLVLIASALFFFKNKNDTKQSFTSTKGPSSSTTSAVQSGTRAPAGAAHLAKNTADSPLRPTLRNEVLQVVARTPQGEKLYNRAMEIFEGLPGAEAAASWVTLGIVFDSSPELGQALQFTMNALNANGEVFVKELKSRMEKFSPSDAFARQMTLNLVNQMTIPAELKRDFFGTEASRPYDWRSIPADSPDSGNIAHAMQFLRYCVDNTADILPYVQAAAENNKDELSRQRLKERFLNFFPEQRAEIEKFLR